MRKMSSYTEEELHDRILNPKSSRRFLEMIIKELFIRFFWKRWEDEIINGTSKIKNPKGLLK